jgi:hypothetical protein
MQSCYRLQGDCAHVLSHSDAVASVLAKLPVVAAALLYCQYTMSIMH